MRTLVTGLDGFTGQYIKTELEAHGYDVIGLKCDLTDTKAVSNEVSKVNPEAIVHLAGIAFVGHGNANDFYNVNLIGTRNLLEATYDRAKNIKSILLASSANIYGNKSQGVLNEYSEPDPSNDYAVSKFAMEKMASLWITRLPLFIVRPFNYTGVGQSDDFVIPKIIKHFREKKSIIELGNLEVWREFGDVRTVAEVYRKLVSNCPEGNTINVCTGHAFSLNEVISLCENISEHKIQVEVNPRFIRENEVRELKGDTALLKNLIDSWEMRKLEDTLRWMMFDGR